jgi:hypothetical protein
MKHSALEVVLAKGNAKVEALKFESPVEIEIDNVRDLVGPDANVWNKRTNVVLKWELEFLVSNDGIYECKVVIPEQTLSANLDVQESEEKQETKEIEIKLSSENVTVSGALQIDGTGSLSPAEILYDYVTKTAEIHF